MGFLDKVKEKAATAAEKGQELAKTQQMKMELKKLEGSVEEAYGAFGRKAFTHHQAGTLSSDSLGPEAQSIHDANAAVAAKQAEISALGDESA